MSETKLKKGDILRIEGQLSLEVKEGNVSVSGGLREKGSRIIIPRSKSVPLEAETEAVVEYKLGPDGKVEQLSERTIPKEWDEIISAVIKDKPKTMMVLGNVDVGKTFFTTYLSNTLLRHGMKVAAIDTDIGQADIGPPTTMGIGILEQPVALLYEVPLSGSYFVGSMSPSGHMLKFLVGVKRLVDIGLKKADLVIVNTPGWTFSGPGRSLQLATLELVNPDLIVTLQRGQELEHLLVSVDQSKVKRLSVSTKVRPRTPEERATLRAMVLKKCFDNARRLVIDLRKVKFERSYLGTGKPIDLQNLGFPGVIYAEKIPEGLVLVARPRPGAEALKELEKKFGPVKVAKESDFRGLVVGLTNVENELLGIGIVEKIDFTRGNVVVLTTVEDPKKVNAIQIGSMKVKPTGEETGTVKPGTF